MLEPPNSPEHCNKIMKLGSVDRITTSYPGRGCIEYYFQCEICGKIEVIKVSPKWR